MYELVITKKFIDDANFKLPYGLPVTSPAVVSAAGCVLIGSNDQESALAFYLDAKNTVVGYSEVARGAIDSCIVDPRIIIRVALLCPGIVSTILIHNHPSGDPNPSATDDGLTKRLYCALRIAGIELLDHVIVTPKGYTYSYIESGKMSQIRLSSCDVLQNVMGGFL